MAIQLQRNSRLRFATLLSVDDVEFFDLVTLPEIPEQAGDLKYRVSGTDRIDLLAHKFYGDPALWWVLAVANGMELVPSALSAGAEIRIPSPSWVAQQLFQKSEVK